MSSPDLQSMTRWLESSNPSDRDEQAWLLTRMNELCDSIAEDLDADLYACLNASVQLLEALASPGEHFPCELVAGVVKRLVESIETTRASRGEGSDAPTPDAPSSAASTPAEPTPAKPTPAAPLPAPEAPSVEPTGVLEFDMQPAMERFVENVTERPAAAAPQAASEIEVASEDIQLDWPAEVLAAETSEPVESARPVEAPEAAEAVEAVEPVAPVEEFPECNDSVLGRMLIELGHVTRAQVASALRLHREKKLRLGECLLLQGATSPERVLNTLKIQDRMRAAKQRDSGPESLEVEVTRTPLRRPMPKKEDGPPPKPAALHVTEKMFIGEVLLGAEMITNEQLEEAMHRHHHDGIRVGEALVQMGALTEEEIQSGLALHESLRHIAGLTASNKQPKR